MDEPVTWSVKVFGATGKGVFTSSDIGNLCSEVAYYLRMGSITGITIERVEPRK